MINIMDYMNFSTKKLIIVVVVMVGIITTLTFVIGRYSKRGTPDTITVASEEESTNIPTLSPENKLTPEEISFRFQPLTITQVDTMNLFIKRLDGNTTKTPDFEIGYSPNLNVFFIRKLTAEADDELKKYMANPRLIRMYEANAGRIFVTIKEPVETSLKTAERNLQKAKDDILNEKIKDVLGIFTDVHAQSAADSTNEGLRQGNEFFDIIKKTFRIDIGTESTPPSSTTELPSPPGGTATTSAGTAGGVFAHNFVGDTLPGTDSLHTVLNQTATFVGIPAKLLKAVINVECRSALNATSEEILASFSSSVDTNYCNPPNQCAAVGPMQVTVGYDDTGSTACAECGNIASCPNTAASLVSQVQANEEIDYTPNPFNYRDNIILGAWYYKALVQGFLGREPEAADWTETNIKHAISCYHNGPNTPSCKTGVDASNLTDYYKKVLDYYFDRN